MTKITNAQLMRDLVASYQEDDKTWGKKTAKLVDAHFAAMKPITNAVDPDRLTTKLNFFTQLRKKIIEKVGPWEEDGKDAKEFNNMSVEKQLRFQKQSQLKGVNKWVHDLEIAPSNIADLKLNPQEQEKQRKLRDKVQEKKLQSEMKKVDYAVLQQRLMPALTDAGAKMPAVIAALLLATGRRTVEILKLGSFHLGKNMTADGYEAVFSGQAKESLFGTDPYAIPLLAPFQVVHDALQHVRKNYPVDGLTNDEVNKKIARTLTNYTTRTVNLTPHDLRGVYAMTTYALSTTKISLIGWVGRVLGHAKVTNAAFYTTTTIENASHWVPKELPVVKQDDEWQAATKPESKVVEAMKEMILKKMPLTASAIRTHYGGSMPLIHRVIAKNQALVDEHNQSLEK